MSTSLHFLENLLTNGSEVVNLMRRLPFTSMKILGTHFCLSKPQGYGETGRTRSTEKSNCLIGHTTRDLVTTNMFIVSKCFLSHFWHDFPRLCSHFIHTQISTLAGKITYCRVILGSMSLNVAYTIPEQQTFHLTRYKIAFYVSAHYVYERLSKTPELWLSFAESESDSEPLRTKLKFVQWLIA
jgi:hypothetical protein